MTTITSVAMKLDDKGRCCGRKPIVYRSNRGHGFGMPVNGFLFCFRCDRAYDRDSGEQISNWAWKTNGQVSFVCQKSGGGK
jgi:hypothetical protein